MRGRSSLHDSPRRGAEGTGPLSDAQFLDYCRLYSGYIVGRVRVRKVTCNCDRVVYGSYLRGFYGYDDSDAACAEDESNVAAYHTPCSLASKDAAALRGGDRYE